MTIKNLIKNLPQQGRVEWLGIRTKKRSPLTALETVAVVKAGLRGDHYAGRSGNRSVTLIQHEHVLALPSLMHREEVSCSDLRRNIVVSGINLLALKDREFQIGGAILKMIGLCHPCSRMEEIFGEGAYNALRGHGGINARVIQEGTIKLMDNLYVI
ncbi:MAG TPA: MOSC domain-containing protein [Gammaproteobacteria bacterium]|nr:MOSC domain-containing protein [Gammaproteobacteria bacterium]